MSHVVVVMVEDGINVPCVMDMDSVGVLSVGVKDISSIEMVAKKLVKIAEGRGGFLAVVVMREKLNVMHVTGRVYKDMLDNEYLIYENSITQL